MELEEILKVIKNKYSDAYIENNKITFCKDYSDDYWIFDITIEKNYSDPEVHMTCNVCEQLLIKSILTTYSINKDNIEKNIVGLINNNIIELKKVLDIEENK